jgi:hypothetical protein
VAEGGALTELKALSSSYESLSFRRESLCDPSETFQFSRYGSVRTTTQARLAHHAVSVGAAPNKSAALKPPRPNEFDRAYATFRCRPLLGM